MDTVVSSASSREKRVENKMTSEVFSSLRTATQSMFQQRTRDLSKNYELQEHVAKLSEEAANTQLLFTKLTEEIAQIDAFCEQAEDLVKERCGKVSELTKTLDQISADHQICIASLDQTKRSVHIIDYFIRSFRYSSMGSTDNSTLSDKSRVSLASLMERGKVIQAGREPGEFRELATEIHRQMRLFSDYVNEMQRTGIFNRQILSLVQEWGRLMKGMGGSEMGESHVNTSRHPELLVLLKRFEALHSLPFVLHHAYQYMVTAGMGGLPCRPSKTAVQPNDSSDTTVGITNVIEPLNSPIHPLVTHISPTAIAPQASPSSPVPGHPPITISTNHQNKSQICGTLLSPGVERAMGGVIGSEPHNNESPLDRFCAKVAPLLLWWCRSTIPMDVNECPTETTSTVSLSHPPPGCYLPDSEYWDHLSFSPEVILQKSVSPPIIEEGDENKMGGISVSNPPSCIATPEQLISTLQKRRSILTHMKDVVMARADALSISADFTYFTAPHQQLEEESSRLYSQLDQRRALLEEIRCQGDTLHAAQRLLVEAEETKKDGEKVLQTREEENRLLEARIDDDQNAFQSWLQVLAGAAHCWMSYKEYQSQIDPMKMRIKEMIHEEEETQSRDSALFFVQAVESLIAEAEVQYFNIMLEESQSMGNMELYARDIIQAQQHEIDRVDQLLSSSLQNFIRRTRTRHDDKGTTAALPNIPLEISKSKVLAQAGEMAQSHDTSNLEEEERKRNESTVVMPFSDTFCDQCVNMLSSIPLTDPLQCKVCDEKALLKEVRSCLEKGCEEDVACESAVVSGHFAPEPSAVTGDMYDEFIHALLDQCNATILWKQEATTADPQSDDIHTHNGADTATRLSLDITAHLLHFEPMSRDAQVKATISDGNESGAGAATSPAASTPLGEWLKKYNCHTWIHLSYFPTILSWFLEVHSEGDASSKELSAFEEEVEGKINAIYAETL